MKIKVTTNKETKEYSIPTCWAQVTTGQYEQMMSEWDREDLIRLFSILSGIDYAAIAISTDYSLEESLINCTRFVYEEQQEFKDADPVKWLTVNGKEIKVPEDIGRLTIGQSINVRVKMDQAKEGATVDKFISLAIAVYLQPIIDGTPYDYFRALEIQNDIKKLPITKTYALGFFLLTPLQRSGKNYRNYLGMMRNLLLRTLQREDKG